MKINTVLLITSDRSGKGMALIQSGVVPLPRIIQVNSPKALEVAWNNQKSNTEFYDSVYSICLDEELAKKKEELGIKDGVYTKVDVTVAISTEVKRYRLGNQSQTYELREDYFGWLPSGYEDWEYLCFDSSGNIEVIIINPEDKSTKDLFLHHFIIKDAFPMSFLLEDRSDKWNIFAIVSEDKNSEKFIIPIF